MRLKLDKRIFNVLGEKFFHDYGINSDDYQFRAHSFLDLEQCELKDMEKLSVALKPYAYERHKKFKEAQKAYKDLNTWIRIVKKGDVKKIIPKESKTFTSALRAMLQKVPGHRMFRLDPGQKNGIWLCYFVSNIEYEPQKTRSGITIPAHTILEVCYYLLGVLKEDKMRIFEPSIIGKDIFKGLEDNGFFIEDQELRKDYLREKEDFLAVVGKVGKQFKAVGYGFDDVDSMDEDDENRFWKDTKNVFLSRDDEPSHVVIDVFKENDVKSDNNDEADDDVDGTFWGDEGTKNVLEIPIHPFLVCFDLKRQLRLRIHISQLSKYVYDVEMGNKLVMPQSHRDLIEALLSSKSGFKDIVKGKGGGAVIICAGPPGLGKTLTSEVYAEVAKRPLYSVQCSQLGTDPNVLEKNLLKIFFRAQRWKAILLLDEADVYVYRRGKDLVQNAVVGVFLRTLEYYRGLMFMTTNRSDLVDDAIASRCVALINYETPSVEDQKKIWEILSKSSNASLSEKEIDIIVKKHNNLSGRDIKNLLKLAIMVASSKDEKVTNKTISLVKKFKPTREFVKEQ